MEKININHFTEWLNAFFRLREITEIKLDQFVDRLSKEVNTYAGKEWIRNNPKANRKPSLIQKIKKECSLIGKLFYRLPLFLIQSKKIASIKDSSSNLIIAMASNRLTKIQTDKNFRDFFAYLIKPFAADVTLFHPELKNIQHDIYASQYLFVSDPLRGSELWKHYKKCWEQQIFILDVDFLLFQAGLAFLKRKATIPFKRMISTRKMIFIASLLLNGYRQTLQQNLANIKAFFLTSNSIATEALRFYLLQNKHCQSVCEIMHGIPAVFYERYLADLLSLHHENTDKHSSISKIPNLPMYGVLKSDVKCGGEWAINSYFNYYLLSKQLDTINTHDFILNEYQQLFANRDVTDRTLIVTFIGGVSTENNFFLSRLFQIEQFLMQLIASKLSKLSQDVIVIYAPHPAYDFHQFSQSPFFASHSILLCQDTILTWLLSDLAFSLFSAALFEAKLFGVASFTPVQVSDHIFPSEWLDFLSNPPQEGKNLNLIASIEAFLEKNYQKTSQNVLIRAQERLQLFYSSPECSVLS